ncbi:hypothetical protein K2173_010316 [Erythroxylum novogranatense]|uniref:RING/U-box protein n=1 Tax=Erythroxylum novogranatense TaxID=1862640 RepID=A0AAV8TEK2_9ROSI|nr:hypothetical protein K2173_010316 [Erythroxylum novogranatense]
MEVDFVTSGILEEENLEIDDDLNAVTSSFEGGRCGICMDIVIDRGVLDCCPHWFCFGCIDNWATITNLCPLCQNEFQLITCVPVYDTVGNNKVDEDLLSRDDDWSVEGKNNTLSFPSYYIDENAVICLDGDGCRIRNGSAAIDEESNLDTSIACDSCDVWYHAFCVGFDPESTSEDSWLCPRCSVDKVVQNSNESSTQQTKQHCNKELSHISCLSESAFPGNVSVSVADTGETAVVVSMVGENKLNQEKCDTIKPSLEISKDQKGEAPTRQSINSQSITNGEGLELSLSFNTSFNQPSVSLVPSGSKIIPAGEVKTPTYADGIKCSLQKLVDNSSSENRQPDGESTLDLHLGLSTGCFLSVDQMNVNGTGEQVSNIVNEETFSKEFFSRDDKIPSSINVDAKNTIGVKRKHLESDEVLKAVDEEANSRNKDVTFTKKTRSDYMCHQTSPEAQLSMVPSDDSQTEIIHQKELKSKLSPENDMSDIMSVVRGTSRRYSKGLACLSPAKKYSEEKENVAGLRVKKIMRRVTNDKESSIEVQKLREEIREAVRNKSAADIGENILNPKLLAAFRHAVAVSPAEPSKKLPALSMKAKRSMLQKGKIRENLTKKIYGNSNGRRKRAWDRDCEVEFWKHRCMRATKPEKIATLKSVLSLLKVNSDGSGLKQSTECQASDPILSRLYIADTSVFPRKDDIKPLSAFSSTSNSEQNAVQLLALEKGQTLSLDDHTPKLPESNRSKSKHSAASVVDGVLKDKVLSLKDKASLSEAQSNRGLEGLTTASLGSSKAKVQKEMDVQCEDKKIDKRKWALEVLARKKALAVNDAKHDIDEENAALKGKYPLLAQLPADMRPVLAPSRHNKIPLSVRQTQLYRLTDHILRKLDLPEIRRTAETELAVADAINIEREVADKSNSKPVYLNLCSQEIAHYSHNNKPIRATESNSSPVSVALNSGLEQISDEPPTGPAAVEPPTDPAVVEALRNAGLLSESPPNSPHIETGTFKDGPDNILEMESFPEVDIYGDFEYTLEDEDYIGATMNVSKLASEDCESRMKVVLSTLKCESLNHNTGFDHMGSGNNETKDPSSLQNSKFSTSLTSSTVESSSLRSRVPSESSPHEEDEDPTAEEFEELYGPDSEPLIDKFPEASRRLYRFVDTKAAQVNKIPMENEIKFSGQSKSSNVTAVCLNSSGGESLLKHSQMSDHVSRADKPVPDKQCDNINSVSKKVEAYIKEHIRPLCKSGIITAEQYRWAVAKTSDKVMKYHLNAKNANFLIKEGERVKKLAEQYVEAAQWKEKE